MNFKKIVTIFLGIIVVASGIFCLLIPTLTYLSIGYIVGVMVLFYAISSIVVWFEVKKYTEISGVYLFDAILSLIFGVVIIISLKAQFIVDMAIVYMICIFLLTMGIMRINLALRIHKYDKMLPSFFRNKKWISILIAGIAMILFAIICMLKPIIMSNFLGIIIGIIIIFVGESIITLGLYSYE